MGIFLSKLFALIALANSIVTGSGSNINKPRIVQDLIIDQTATVTVTAWQGSATCTGGEILLVNPQQDKNLDISPTTISKTATKTTPTANIGTTIISNYSTSKQTVKLGPFEKGTKIVLGLKAIGQCKGTYLSTDPKHFQISRWGTGNSYTMALEDSSYDQDFNDVYIELTLTSVENKLTDTITTVQAFDQNQVYKLPWPASVKHKLTQIPGKGEHSGNDAYDWDMKIGDEIRASRKGLVLWIEDSFDSGSCNPLLRPKVNVLVIQTEDGVNQTYVHLNRGSVKEAKIRVGDVVQQGQFIGRAGNSGYICADSGTGSHLHIEWQHNCYDVTEAKKRRGQTKSKVGQPTFAWSCPNFPANAPYNFTSNNQPIPTKVFEELTSDNN